MFGLLPPTDFWEIIVALIISSISAAISISRRVLQGHAVSFLWITSEYLTAILCGYLMFNGYPEIQHLLPTGVTLPIAIAVAAHSGGRIFQELESTMLVKYQSIFKQKKD